MKFIARANGRACKLQMTYKREVIREVNGTIIKEPTQYIQFDSEGTYQTTDKDKIAFIKSSKLYGLEIHPVEEEVFQTPQETIQTMAQPDVSKKKGRPKKVE